MKENRIIDQVFNYHIDNWNYDQIVSKEDFWKYLYVDRPNHRYIFDEFYNSNSNLLFLEGGIGSGKTTLLQFVFGIQNIAPYIELDLEQFFLYKNRNEKNITDRLKKIIGDKCLHILLNLYSEQTDSSSITTDEFNRLHANSSLNKPFLRDSYIKILADIYFELPYDILTHKLLKVYLINEFKDKDSMIKRFEKTGRIEEFIDSIEWYHLLHLIQNSYT